MRTEEVCAGTVGTGRVIAAFAAFADLWERRLAEGWTPPEGSPYPWAQVRLSLAALLPGFRTARREEAGGGVVALILAGNTPLLAWPAMAAALLAGHAVSVKMSRDETLWPRLFVEALAEADADVAACIHLDVWPGEDDRTRELVQAADAVVAYGSDASIAALRKATPAETPFFGFGHALSVGFCAAGASLEAAASGFARDVLMYDQGGCLSPHTLFVEGEVSRANELARLLARAFPEQAVILDVLPVMDAAVARKVREARDMALFDGAAVIGDDSLRWTILVYPRQREMPLPTGHGTVSVIPIEEGTALASRFGEARGLISSVGVAGEIASELRAVLEAEGVSRLCPPGEMQMPPLDWPNGGIDLRERLASITG